ncbi:hypothetical protein ABNQ39_11515 [Azospirillum sp. A26]|uniref:hypothetical protein n=1 Tax=Azospirillum sp. A26 TaxID=3160607 RepID=UPI00366E88F9
MSEHDVNGPDWTGVPEAIAKEISRQGEVRTAALMTISLATVQRAMTFASITATATTATVGAGIASASGSPLFAGLTAPAFTAALFFWLSCILCVTQARPIPLHAPGKHPQLLYGDTEYMAGPAQRSFGWDAETYQTSINFNEECLARDGRHMMTAIWLAVFAPAAALISWVAEGAGVGAWVAAVGQHLGFL